MPAVVESSLLDEIRALRSFSQNCDLDARASAAADPVELLEQLILEKHVLKAEAGLLWSRRLGVAYVDPTQVSISEDAVARLPAEVTHRVQALPLYRFGESLTVALAHPGDAAMVRRLGNIAQVAISPVFAFPADIAAMLRIHYSTEETLEAAMKSVESLHLFAAGVDLNEGGREIARLAASEEVIKFTEALLFFAMRRQASDVHIEPREKESIVRFRIDGNLWPVLTFPRRLHASIATRFKILSQVDIVETRFPSDGGFSQALGSIRMDFRFSSIPSQYGEKVVIRLLGSTDRKTLLSLDKMMISQRILRPLRRLLQSPSGIIFVTGPTGSGKTTTLYAALAELNDSKVNISTIEDPIEMRLEGVNQTQVNHKIDLSFARMLRSLLRQDPDVLLVGEIRDAETAKIATEAALTGHLVLATMHTNSAPEAIVRLADMGVDPYMIAPTVNAVLAQRLAARICENCKEPYRPTEEVLRRYFDDPELPEVTFYRGRGCHICNHTGYRGRVAFHELFLVNRRMRSLITKGTNLFELAELAGQLGYRPLRYDGLKKVLLGLTTVEEIEAQTPVEFEG